MNQRHKTIVFVVFLLMATNLSFAMYDPQTGRFMQQDPLGIQPDGGRKQNPFDIDKQYIDGMNINQYANSNPILHSDMLGLYYPLPAPSLQSVRTNCTGGCKGRCGPDITSSFDRVIEQVGIYLDEEFKKPDRKGEICGDGLLGLGGIYSKDGWDIAEFFDDDFGVPMVYGGFIDKGWPSSKAPCNRSVVYKGNCVNMWELNYFLWGYLNKKCETPDYKYYPWTYSYTTLKPAAEIPACKRSFANCGRKGTTVDETCYLNKCCEVSGAPETWVSAKVAGESISEHGVWLY